MFSILATWTCALALTLAPGSPRERTAEDASSQARPGLGLDLSDAPTPGSQDSSLGLDLSSETASTAEGPRILVVPPAHGQRLDLRGYHRLMVALAPRFGARLVPEGETLRAIRELKLSAVAVQTPAGLVQLAERVEAQRALSFKVERRDLLVLVYAPPERAVTATVRADRAGPLTEKDARRVAAELVARASDALNSSPGHAPKAPGTVAVAESSVVDQDLLEEGGQVRHSDPLADTPGSPGPARRPMLLLGIGGGADVRTLGMTGPALELVAPVEMHPLPLVAVSLSLFPLHLLDPGASASWSDAVVEGRFRRSLAAVRYQQADGSEGRCGLNDDGLLVRAAWRYRLGGRAPSVGVGAGWSTERTVFDCPVQLVSTRYQVLEAHLRARQLLWSDRLAIDALVGPRILLAGPTADRPGTTLMGELAITGQLTPLFFTRFHARLTSTRLGQADRLDINDLRTTFGLDMGVSL